MDIKKLKNYLYTINFLIYFQEILTLKPFNAFINFLTLIVKNEELNQVLKSYNAFINSISKEKIEDFSLYIKNNVIKNKIENPESIKKEIEIINNFIDIDFKDIKSLLLNAYTDYKDICNFMPSFNTSKNYINMDDFTSYTDKKENDIFDTYNAFVFDIDLEIKPIKTKEKITFNDLKEYTSQKEVLYKNTLALLQNKKVNNILLYGDAGCGKSSSIRALLNEFKEIKIIQIFKNNLINLDKLYSQLEHLNHKFIIFADDITFSENDENFSTMKAILEGSLIQCPKNVVIYATSNRKHLVKESFQARSGDEIHLNDTINELNSLSERFGINLLFSKPNNHEFINIVLALAKDNNIDMDEKILIQKAQRFALIKGTNSPRVAKQLIDNLIANVDI